MAWISAVNMDALSGDVIFECETEIHRLMQCSVFLTVYIYIYIYIYIHIYIYVENLDIEMTAFEI